MSVNLQKAEFVRSAAKAGDFPRDRPVSYTHLTLPTNSLV